MHNNETAHPLPDPLITFGDSSLESLIRAVTAGKNGIVAVVPIGAAMPPAELDEFDIHLDRVDAAGIHGRFPDADAEPGEVSVSYSWTDIKRIHIY